MGRRRDDAPGDAARGRGARPRRVAHGPGRILGAAAAAAEAAPRGGRLRVGHVGAGKGESFNPGRGSSFIDASRYYNLYDPLVRVNPDFSQSPGLAL